MGDSSSDEDSPEWILYANRSEWKDMMPIPQDDGPYPVVSIAYSERYRDVYDYFRGAVHIGEKSERVLALCRDAIILNPANYNVWQYRRHVLKHLKSDLKEELDYIANVIKDNLKIYQAWHHRRVIVEWLNDGSRELDFINEVLIADTKNYHAWQHRQWVLLTFKLFDGELEYVNQMLTFDIRNNSVWNYRYFILNSLPEGFSIEVIDKEIEYVLNILEKPPINNESAWNYLRGILLHSEAGLTEPKVREFSLNLHEEGCRSVHLLSFLADSNVEIVEKNIGDIQQYFKNAIQMYSELAKAYDVIRTSYWNFVIQELHQRYPQLIVS